MKKMVMLIIPALILCSCKSTSINSRPNPNSLDTFLKDRNAAGRFLGNSFTVLPEGASLTTSSSKLKHFDGTFPGDSHIRDVVTRQSWNSHSEYFFTLNLSDEMLSSSDQDKSETMAATQLLFHFFGGLSSFGFRNMGSPSVLTEYPIQYATNTWFREPDGNISIFGSVYVNLQNKTALIDLKTAENY